MARIQVLFAIAAAAAVATAARAHQGGVDVRGVVQAVAPDRIEVATANGLRAFGLTSATEFVKAGAPGRREDVRPGDRVVVHGRARGGGLEAVRVEIGVPRRSRP